MEIEIRKLQEQVAKLEHIVAAQMEIIREYVCNRDEEVYESTDSINLEQLSQLLPADSITWEFISGNQTLAPYKNTKYNGYTFTLIEPDSDVYYNPKASKAKLNARTYKGDLYLNGEKVAEDIWLFQAEKLLKETK